MAANSFGEILRLTTWGESHGESIGGILDGVPPGLVLDIAEVQKWLDRRRPGQSRHVSPRREPDRIRVLSGLFEGKTTGHPISFSIANLNVRSGDYDRIAHGFRPGHADYTWLKKYGLRDYRGGGRSSARETACRVAGGAMAFQVLESLLERSIDLRGGVVAIGGKSANPKRFDWSQTTKNPFFSPDPHVVPSWEALLDSLRREGSSCGALIEVRVGGLPPGLGDPVYGKLDACLASALMSINAVKGVEIGAGFASASLRGEENADAMSLDPEGRVVFSSNHSGGILGGISTGQDLIVRFAVKPTSSIRRTQKSLNEQGEQIDIQTRGRHDPCVGIRAVAVGEAMVALVLADQAMRHRSVVGRWPEKSLP